MRIGLAVPPLIVAVALSARAAHADPADTALAETLFDAGRALLAEGKTDEACQKFSDSLRIEAKLGTLLNLALCHETQGRTASAWAEFKRAEAMARSAHDDDRRAYAKQHLTALQDRLSFVTVKWMLPAPGQTLELDGVAVGESADGTPLPVDPGSHVLSVQAPGRRSWSHDVSVPSGPSSKTVEVPELAAMPETQSATKPSAAPTPLRGASPRPPRAAPARAETAPASPHASQSTARRAVEIGAFAVGVIGVAVGTWAGLSAIAENRSGESECDASGCTARGRARIHAAGTKADVSTVAFAVGAAGIAGGTYLAVTASSSHGIREARIQARFEF